MTDAFLIIAIVAVVGGVVLSLTRVAWPFAVLRDVGRTGSWFHHQDMDADDAQPDGNQNDPAILHRPIRGRD